MQQERVGNLFRFRTLMMRATREYRARFQQHAYIALQPADASPDWSVSGRATMTSLDIERLKIPRFSRLTRVIIATRMRLHEAV